MPAHTFLILDLFTVAPWLSPERLLRMVHYHAPPPPCSASCEAFLRHQGVNVTAAPAVPSNDTRQVAIVSCSPLTLGGVQLRCTETARMLTAHGLPASCHGPARKVGIGRKSCGFDDWEALLAPVIALKRNVLAIIFLRDGPPPTLIKKLRETCAPLLLDAMDARATDLCATASSPRLPKGTWLDGLIVANNVSLDGKGGPQWISCPALRDVPIWRIEHHHSVTRRVGWGERNTFRTALLVQEHRILKNALGYSCDAIGSALDAAGVDKFHCHGLWGSETLGIDHRETFLRKELSFTAAQVQAIEGQYLGTGALFTAIFARFDLLIVWHETQNTVQRLSNALATGIPVIARRIPTHEAAFRAHPGVLLVRDMKELASVATSLNQSRSLRAATSDAGVHAAQQFSRAAVSERYRRAVVFSRRLANIEGC